MSRNDPLFYSVNNNNSDSRLDRKCIVTGFDISMQVPSSKFLTPVGLKWCFNNDLDNYNKIKLRFLPRTGISGLRPKHERDEFKHIAKQIRNHFHNSRRNKPIIKSDQLYILLLIFTEIYRFRFRLLLDWTFSKYVIRIGKRSVLIA